MRTGLTVSTIAHTGLILVAVIGLGLGKPLETPPVESIAVDLVPIEEFSNIRVGSLDSEIVETETPAAVVDDTPPELAQPTGNTEEDQVTPQDDPESSPAPTEETAPAPLPEPEPEPVVEPEPEAAPVPAARPVVEPEPVPEPEPEPVEPAPALATPEVVPDPAESAPRPIVKTAALDQKRAAFKQQQADQQKQAEEQKQQEAAKKKAEAEKKKKAEEQKRIEEAKRQEDESAKLADEVANIINDEASRGATTGEGGKPTLGKQDGRSATLSQSEMDGLAGQIRACINMPAGAEDIDARAEIVFKVAGDGSVVGQAQVTSAATSQVEEAYARAVARAIMRCGPYALVAGQDVRAQFRAREF